MASQAPNRNAVARASAVLTTGEVAAAKFDLNEAFDSQVSVQVDFTLGMLTNVTLRGYVSMDGTTWYNLSSILGGATSAALTADAAIGYVFRAPGWKWFRLTAQGSGTVTNSLLALTYRWLRRGTQM